ncbi:mucin-7 [Triticum aestivum]|nr:mucin-7-like [Triticum aestivum]
MLQLRLDPGSPPPPLSLLRSFAPSDAMPPRPCSKPASAASAMEGAQSAERSPRPSPAAASPPPPCVPAGTLLPAGFRLSVVPPSPSKLPAPASTMPAAPSGSATSAAVLAAVALASRKAAPAAGGHLSRVGLPPRLVVAAFPTVHSSGLPQAGSSPPPPLGCLSSPASADAASVSDAPSTSTATVGAPSPTPAGAATSYLTLVEASPTPPAGAAEAPPTTPAAEAPPTATTPAAEALSTAPVETALSSASTILRRVLTQSYLFCGAPLLTVKKTTTMIMS